MQCYCNHSYISAVSLFLYWRNCWKIWKISFSPWHLIICSARQSSQLSSVFSRPLPTDFPKSPPPEYGKLPPEYTKLSSTTAAAEYKLPPDYTRITNDYSKLLPDYVVGVGGGGAGVRLTAAMGSEIPRDSSLPPSSIASSQVRFGFSTFNQGSFWFAGRVLKSYH